MAAATYAEAMKQEMRYEGGKVDHPEDPGGRTNMGVIQRVYSAWRRKNGRPDQSVYLMSIEERDAIYRQNYANAIQYDKLPEGVDITVLDGAINSGVSQSVKWVQRALGLTADGVLGDVTLEAINNYHDHDYLVGKILERRMAFLRALKTFKTFGKGWTARVNHVRKVAQSWASGSIGQDIEWTPVPGAERKAMITQAMTAPPRVIGDVTGTVGGMSTTLGTVQGTLEPLQGNPWVDRIILYCIVGGVLLTVIGGAAAWYARKRAEQLNDVLDLTPQIAPNNNDVVDSDILAMSDAPQTYQGAPAISKGV